MHTAFHLWLNDLAAEKGMPSLAISYAWIGEFHEDGVLVPDGEAVAVIPAYHRGGAVVDSDDSFVVQILFYAAPPLNRYAVVETVWEEEPEPPTKWPFPIGKPAPDGTAPLRYLEEVMRQLERDEDLSLTSPMVAWDEDNVPCPLRCHAYPEVDLGMSFNEWYTEEEVREKFPQLWE